MNENELAHDSKKSTFQEEWHAVLAALHFLTIIPPFRHISFSARELSKSVAYYPIIGCLIGCFLWGLERILSLLFPSSVVAALLIALWVGISGALHFDGYLDSCDGILGGSNPEERLAIMKDEHVGAFALIGGILLILIKYTSLVSIGGLTGQALFLSPIISRWGMSIAVVCFPYGRAKGLGLSVKKFGDWKQATVATIIAVIAAWFISGATGLVILLISALAVLLMSKYLMSKIPGLTGDSYGAINEIIEVLVLIGFSIVCKNI